MVFIGFISLFGFVGLTFIYGALAYNTKKLINNPLIKAQLELKKETSLLTDVTPRDETQRSDDFEKFKRSSFLKGSKYLILKRNIEINSKLTIESSNNLLKHLEQFYNIEEHFKYLINQNFTDNSILRSYIKNLHELIDKEFQDHKENLSKGYVHSAKNSNSKLLNSCHKLLKSLETFEAELKSLRKNTKIVVKVPVVNPIEEKHLKLNNVISNSLYNNSLNLQHSLTSENPEIKALAEAQLKQINKFLDKEINNSGLETEAQLINKLKSNQRYLDSLEINWISEDKI